MLTNMEISSFCGQMAMVLKSGISAIDGVEIMRDDAATEKGKALLSKVYDSLSESGSLADSLKMTGECPDYAVDMIRIGEQSGKLETVMRSLSAYYKREDSIADGIRNAVTYPLIMILMMFAVVGVLIVKVLPIFGSVYQDLGTELTGPARALLSFSVSSGRYLIVLLVVLAVIFAILIILMRTNTKFRTKFPLSRTLSRKIAEGRFAGGMALTLEAGLDTDESMELVGKAADHPLVTARIEKCASSLKEGRNFAEAVSESEVFPPVYARMVDIGVRSGSLDEVMKNISELYEEEIDGRISRMLSILEPTLVIILSVIVAVILLSVMLPLMSVMSSL